MMRRVLILQRRLPEYRVAFFERLRTLLASREVDLALVHGSPAPEESSRDDQGTLPWANPVRTRYVPLPGTRLVLQDVPSAMVRAADLVIAPHESAYLAAYPILRDSRRRGARFAFWGHGAPTQPSPEGSLRRRFKRFTTGLPDWWFAYTELSVARVVATGFPADRVTCVQNAVPTDGHSRADPRLQAVRATLRRNLGIDGHHVGVFLGSLTPERRLAVVVSTADLVRARLPDFHLVVVGDGPLAPFMRTAASTRPWMHLCGARHGHEKVAYCSLGEAILNPGMVGLNIVDAFALGLPMITADHPFHSPEIAYLVSGENGLSTKPDPGALAEALVRVLEDDPLRERLRAGCALAASRYTIENMAVRFADGICSALAAPLRRGRASKVPGPRDYRVLVIHPALAPYRVDFFNALSKSCSLRLLFLHDNVREQPFDQARLRAALTAEARFLTRGMTLARRTLRFGLRHEILDYGPDVVVTTEFSPTTLAVLAQRSFLSRSLAHVVWTDDNPVSVSRDVWARRVARAISLACIDGLVVLSDEASAMYRTRYRARVPIGVSPLLQDEVVFRNHLRRAYPLARARLEEWGLAGRRVVLSVGRLMREKRIDRVIAAHASLRKTEPDLALVVVGDGPERARLGKLALSLGSASDVIFVGHHEGPSLHAWYLVGSVLVLASEFEPFGAVVNEALLAGMPVVCSDRAGARSLINAGVTGSVVDASDIVALRGAVAAWLPPRGSPALDVARPSLMGVPFDVSLEGFFGVLRAARAHREARRSTK